MTNKKIAQQSLLVKALNREPLERPPVWLMRQAGRYMPEYMKLKEKYSFLDLCNNPELAFEVTMQPINAFDPDAAIVFSDILIPLQRIGIEIDYIPGPTIGNPIIEVTDLKRINIKEEKPTNSNAQTIEMLKSELDSSKGVLGFIGSPWTLATYIINPKQYKEFQSAKIFANEYPEEVQSLLSILTEVLIDDAKQQVEAGADCIQIFDSWGGILEESDYRRLSLPWINKIIDALPGTSTIVYVGSGSHLSSVMSEFSSSGLSLDWRFSNKQIKEFSKNGFTIQGTLDPCKLYSSDLKSLTENMLEHYPSKTKNGDFIGYIANLGHGILKTTNPNQVKLFVDTIKEWKK